MIMTDAMMDFDVGPANPKEVAHHDPGGKVRLPIQAGILGLASFSECGKYRHWLSRNWSMRRFSDGRCGPWILWIGMNPSTAQADVDDSTVRREMAFTRRMGADIYVKVNVMDYRSTNPKALLSVDPRSPQNLETIVGLATDRDCVRVIAAWGALPKPLRQYADDVVVSLRGRQIYCMGKTKDGFPRHPLYLPNSAECVPWP
jgi:hypothetical protein